MDIPLSKRVVFVAVFLSAAAGFFTEQSAAIQTASPPPASGLSADEIISPEELFELKNKDSRLVIFDARDRDQFLNAHIQGAVLPEPEDYYRLSQLYQAHIVSAPPDAEAALRESTKDLPQDAPIVTYCNASCLLSARLLRTLKTLGFKNVRSLEAGFQAWEEKGYPVSMGTPRLSSDTLR